MDKKDVLMKKDFKYLIAPVTSLAKLVVFMMTLLNIFQMVSCKVLMDFHSAVFVLMIVKRHVRS